MYKILAVDDESFLLELLGSVLGDYDLVTAGGVESAKAELEKQSFDIILLDIQMADGDGYGLCQDLRESDAQTPVLFVSQLTDQESRLKAYGVGGNDYIAKPYEPQDLRAKIERLIDGANQQKRLQKELEETWSLVQQVQQQSAHIHTVSRFVQLSRFCKDVDRLMQVFFVTIRELGTSAVVMLDNDENSIESDDGNVARLEREILVMSGNSPRIHSFGKDRCIFRWQKATLLVRHIDELIDVLAILMDSLEYALISIKTGDALLDQMQVIEAVNQESKEEIRELVGKMTQEIQNSLFSLGVMSSLCEEEEERINDIVDEYKEAIQRKFDHQQDYADQLRLLMADLRKPPAEAEAMIEEMLKGDEEDELSGVDLF